jgi:hypothetical protein
LRSDERRLRRAGFMDFSDGVANLAKKIDIP